MDIKNCLRKWILNIVLRTNHYWSFSFLYKSIYSICIWFMRMMFKGMPEIKAAYIVHDLDSYDWVPGDSDIDVAIVTECMTTSKELVFLQRFWKRLRIIKKLFPFVSYNFGGFPICDMHQLGGPHFTWGANILEIYSFSQWKLFYGSEVRHLIINKNIKEYKARYPLNPDFQTIPLKYFIMPFFAGNLQHNLYIRKYYRVVIKSMEYIYLKENGVLEKSESRLFDFFYRKKDSVISSLLTKMDELKRAGYFVRDRGYAAELILTLMYGLIKIFDRYHASLLLDIESVKGERARKYKPQQEAAIKPSMPEEVQTFVRKIISEGEHIESIIYCPSPNLLPFRFNNSKVGKYELYIVIDNNISLDSFKFFITYIKKELHGSRFEDELELLVTTRSILLSQEYGSGTYFALHLFHLCRYGVCAYGRDVLAEISMPPKYLLEEAIRRELSRESLRRIKSYLSDVFIGKSYLIFQYCMRRLLSYRLFLEKDIIATQPDEIINGYRNNFSQENLYQEIKTILQINPNFRIAKENAARYYLVTKSLLNKMGY